MQKARRLLGLLIASMSVSCVSRHSQPVKVERVRAGSARVLELPA